MKKTLSIILALMSFNVFSAEIILKEYPSMEYDDAVLMIEDGWQLPYDSIGAGKASVFLSVIDRYKKDVGCRSSSEASCSSSASYRTVMSDKFDVPELIMRGNDEDMSKQLVYVDEEHEVVCGEYKKSLRNRLGVGRWWAFSPTNKCKKIVRRARLNDREVIQAVLILKD